MYFFLEMLIFDNGWPFDPNKNPHNNQGKLHK